MNIKSMGWILVALVVIAGGWYWWSAGHAQREASDATSAEASVVARPTQATGINGSPNQGNLGGTDTGVVQKPLSDGAEGTIIGANVALGTDSTSTLGAYLIAYNGMTVYTFSKDTTTMSTCYGPCAANWPPYLVGPEDNLTQLKAGVAGKVDTTTRKGGALQMTYNGHPLYFYAKDALSGDTQGQGMGKVWFVVKP